MSRVLTRVATVALVAVAALFVSPGIGLAWYYEQGFSKYLPCASVPARGETIPLARTGEPAEGHTSRWTFPATTTYSDALRSTKKTWQYRAVSFRVVDPGTCVNGNRNVRMTYAAYEHRENRTDYVKAGDGEMLAPGWPAEGVVSEWRPGVGPHPIPGGQP
ncbi:MULTISPECIES: hypothetical protein [Pseudonocardia]|uniref:Uncharacterized protein n=2 Tax=Pseudonocardia TaxID=1847 RepID=A0A1Y2N7N7_PSEAH|nr:MULTISPECIES: hypothetical protein [Pseudonocardia]OSY43211.1 hypothetical protein BG845_00816 [Pseudonocardia autotrophica]TDN71699.1 hypothetical protein C8E95_0733 [Pseudonocardia autotrophica]BBG02386.1 hypothetical protein Pdca_35950 [Pseudonocardia autotrophica]GEC23278.1 hypothetical protein PSA01_03070 [Pseudonocardia saturnea]